MGPFVRVRAYVDVALYATSATRVRHPRWGSALRLPLDGVNGTALGCQAIMGGTLPWFSGKAVCGGEDKLRALQRSRRQSRLTRRDC